jgi:tRNA(fMet)-specific endonuclease VapC
MESADELLIPATVIGELMAGFHQGTRKDANLKLFEQFLAEPGVSVAVTDRTVAQKYGLLVAGLKAAGTPIPTNDIWIAATALCANACLLTGDRHFRVITGLDVDEF